MTTYTGGCHCGRVRYGVAMDIENVLACNCSHCSMKGFLLTFVPADSFTLQSGEDSLTEYRFNKQHIAHRFCANCGVQSFAEAPGPDGTPMVAINARCLDNVDIESLAVVPFDGKAV